MRSSSLPIVVALGAIFSALAVTALEKTAVRGGARDAKPSSVSSASFAPSAPWAEAVEAGADHIDARDLVRRLAADPSGVLLVDVRPPDEFAAFSLRGAHNLSLPRLLGPEGAALLDARPQALVVLVSNGMTHPGQAWVELTRRGRTNCRVLEEGIDGLRSGLLLPPSLRGPTTEADAKAALAEHALATKACLGGQSLATAHGVADPARAPSQSLGSDAPPRASK